MSIEHVVRLIRDIAKEFPEAGLFEVIEIAKLVVYQEMFDEIIQEVERH